MFLRLYTPAISIDPKRRRCGSFPIASAIGRLSTRKFAEHEG